MSVSDDTDLGTPPAANAPQPTGGFDWLLESHEQSSVPLAPDDDLRQTSAPPAIAFAVQFPDIGAPPTPADAAPDAAGSGAGVPGGDQTGLGLSRRVTTRRPQTSPFDWTAFVLAFVVAPLGLLAGIGAIVVGIRNNGFASNIAKAAVTIGAVLTVVLGIGLIGLSNLAAQQAAHNAVAASSVTWCTQLKSNPNTLASNTFGWPSPGNTIPDSITSMQTYENSWLALVKVAPKGIQPDTQQVATSAQSIINGVKSTQTLDDASDVSTMQSVVAASGIPAWVSEYCK
jgi:hypothetical protein